MIYNPLFNKKVTNMRESPDGKSTKKYSCKKLTKFKRGTICQAVKIVNIDHISQNNVLKSLLTSVYRILCCDWTASKDKSSDLAIEFRVIQNLTNMEASDNGDSSPEAFNLFKGMSSTILYIVYII